MGWSIRGSVTRFSKIAIQQNSREFKYIQQNSTKFATFRNYWLGDVLVLAQRVGYFEGDLDLRLSGSRAMKGRESLTIWCFRETGSLGILISGEVLRCGAEQPRDTGGWTVKMTKSAFEM